MNFLLSEQQLEIQNTATRFLTDSCNMELLLQQSEASDWQAKAIWQQFCELGFAGIGIPEAYDGFGLEMVDLAIVAEQLGRTAAPLPYLGHSLCALAINEFGSDEQKQSWLPKLASGELLGSIAIAENDNNWSADQWSLGSGVTLNGEKKWVPFAAHADLLVVGTANGSLQLVNAKNNGLDIKKVAGIDPSQPISSIVFNDSHSETLGGTNAAQRLTNAALVLLAADAFGAASNAITMAVEYANTRVQFGRPIGSFQGLKHQLANMSVALEPSRGLYWYAAHAYNHVQDDSEKAAALAKAHITDVALQVVRDATEAHGGIGYTWEYSLQLFFKRVMFDFAYFGNPSTHRKRISLLENW